MKRERKLYTDKGFNTPQHIAFTDGSAVIHLEDGSMIIIEAQKPYGMNNLFYKFDDFNIALN